MTKIEAIIRWALLDPVKEAVTRSGEPRPFSRCAVIVSVPTQIRMGSNLCERWEPF
jgi:hypothetical protein